MIKSFAWIVRSIITAACMLGIVGVKSSMAVPFPSRTVLSEIFKYGDGSTIRRSYPCKIPILIPSDVPRKYDNSSILRSVDAGSNNYEFGIRKGVLFYASSRGFKSKTDGDKIKIVELTGGFQGRYLYGGRYVYGRSVLEWQYGGATYGVWLSEGTLQDAISIANSAIEGGIQNPKPGQNPVIATNHSLGSPVQANTDVILADPQSEAEVAGASEEIIGTSQPDPISTEIPDASQPEVKEEDVVTGSY
jgi:hypothetical protein